MPAFGLASSGAILVGQAIGAGEHDRVPGIVKLTMKVAAVWQGSVGLLYLVFPTLLMGLFAPPGGGAELVRVGIIMLAISAAWQLFDAAVITLSEALRAAGDTTWSMWARVVGAWLLFIPAATIAVLVFDGGFVAAMLCMLVYIASLAAAFGWRFRRGAWRDIDLTGEDAELVIALPETS
jgi:MATE family multidrug resistance protein